MQHFFVSGNFGASPIFVGFIVPGVRVKVLTAYDGKLLPCIFTAVTVISYIVNGFSADTIVSLVLLGALTWIASDVFWILVMSSSGSMRRLSNVRSEVTLTSYIVTVSKLEVGLLQETFRDLSVKVSTSTTSGALGSSSVQIKLLKYS